MKILILGIGGAGSLIVDELYREQMLSIPAEFAICNNDRASLARKAVAERYYIETERISTELHEAITNPDICLLCLVVGLGGKYSSLPTF